MKSKDHVLGSILNKQYHFYECLCTDEFPFRYLRKSGFLLIGQRLVEILSDLALHWQLPKSSQLFSNEEVLRTLKFTRH